MTTPEEISRLTIELESKYTSQIKQLGYNVEGAAYRSETDTRPSYFALYVSPLDGNPQLPTAQVQQQLEEIVKEGINTIKIQVQYFSGMTGAKEPSL